MRNNKMLLQDVSVRENKLFTKDKFVNKQLKIEDVLYNEMTGGSKGFLRRDTFLLSEEVADKVSDGIIGILSMNSGSLDQRLEQDDILIVYKSSAKKVRQKRIDSSISSQCNMYNFDTKEITTVDNKYMRVRFYDYWTNDCIYLITRGNIYITTLSEFYNNDTEMELLPYPQLNIYTETKTFYTVYNNHDIYERIERKRINASRICVGGTFRNISQDNTIKSLIDTAQEKVTAIQSSANNTDLGYVGNLRLSPVDLPYSITNTMTTGKATYYHLGMIALGKSQAHIQTKEEAREYYKKAVLPKGTEFTDWAKDCLMQELIDKDPSNKHYILTKRQRYKSLAVLFNQNIINHLE